ncbi:hypothetical protein CC86DRAFT_453950 [Ophiobolus disseminans]|uniref:Apple domain-containing protein n=1 Tax=Ophiobolus disseminans TaxID=1469910 RepID=A0A6A7A7Z9_9PLEO|nr:hypothetical protein CC86DRAFT_453950 [Ophiobolus disseminans]
MADAPQVAYPQRGDLEHTAISHASLYSPHKEAGGQHIYAGMVPKPSHVCGLRRRTFWSVLAIVMAVAVLGGSVGGSYAVRKKECNAPSTLPPTVTVIHTALVQSSSLPTPASPTASNGPMYTPLAPDIVGLIDNACPTSNTLRSDTDTYTCYGEQDLPGYDASGLVAYTLQQCIDACSTMNYVAKKTTCRAVLLNNRLSSTYSSNHRANCWLKTVAGSAYLSTQPIGTVAMLEVR